MKPRILITVSGGNIQDIKSFGEVDVYVRDWDNIEQGDSKEAEDYPVNPITAEQMDLFITAEWAEEAGKYA